MLLLLSLPVTPAVLDIRPLVTARDRSLATAGPILYATVTQFPDNITSASFFTAFRRKPKVRFFRQSVTTVHCLIAAVRLNNNP